MIRARLVAIYPMNTAQFSMVNAKAEADNVFSAMFPLKKGSWGFQFPLMRGYGLYRPPFL